MGYVVLAVDDNSKVTEFAKEVLTPLGYQVETAANGVEALSRVLKSPVDLILLDLIMPRMNGYRFCKALEQKNLDEKTIVILLSSADEKMGSQVKERTCARDFVSKPVSAKQLQEVVKKYLPLTDSQKPDRKTVSLPDLSVTSDDNIASYLDLQMVLRDRLHNAVGAGLAARLDEIMGTPSFDEVLGIITEVLSDAVSDELVDELIDRIRSSPQQKPEA